MFEISKREVYTECREVKKTETSGVTFADGGGWTEGRPWWVERRNEGQSEVDQVRDVSSASPKDSELRPVQGRDEVTKVTEGRRGRNGTG